MSRSFRLPIGVGITLALAACDNGLLLASPVTSPAATTPAPLETTTSTPAVELCDGIDNDGDGQIDEGLLRTWYEDADLDGFGSPSSTVEACTPPDGFIDVAGDCDDSEPTAWDGAADDCDGIDNDCDGLVDEDHRSDWVLSTVHSDGTIYQFDPTFGTVTASVTLSGPPIGSSSSTDTRDAGLVIVHDRIDAYSSELRELDVCTGTLEPLVDIGASSLPGISFGRGGVLYGIDSVGDRIVEASLATGALSTKIAFDFDVGNAGMAWDCTTERLWVADRDNAQVFWVDPANWSYGGAVAVTVPFEAVGLEWNPAGGNLWASTGTELWTIEPTTGASTFVMDFDGLENVNDLALFPECP